MPQFDDRERVVVNPEDVGQLIIAEPPHSYVGRMSARETILQKVKFLRAQADGLEKLVQDIEKANLSPQAEEVLWDMAVQLR